MKIKILLGATIAGLSALFIVGKIDTKKDFYVSNYSPRVDSQEKAEAEGMIEYMKSVRGPVNGFSNEDMMKAMNKASQMGPSRAGLGLEFTPMGPTNIGGRTRSIVVDRDNSSRLYGGSVSGGIFLSVNGGNSWSTTFDVPKADGKYQPNIMISAMTQDADGNIYAGTGCTFEGGATGINGVGMYVSRDRGLTWNILPSTDHSLIAAGEFLRVNDVKAHPSNGKIIAAATNRGLRVSTDGGSSWNTELLCVSGNVLTTECHTIDFSLTGDKLYVGLGSGVFFMGSDFTTKCGFSIIDSVKGAGGLRPRNLITTSPNNNEVCYVGITNGTGAHLVDIQVTKDGGKTWGSMNPPIPSNVAHYDIFGASRNNGASGQAFYDFSMRATKNPNKAGEDMLFVGGVQMWRFDGNWTLTSFGGSGGNSHNDYSMHVDHHIVTQDPKNPNNVYFGNDGGIWKSIDGGYKFFDVNKGYMTTQFYDIAIATEDYVIGGTQDNGNIFVTPLRPGNPDFGTGVTNQGIVNGDGFDATVSQITDIKYTSAQNGNLGRSRISSTRGSGTCTPYCGRSGFRTYVSMWESANDTLSRDSIGFAVDTAEIEIGLGTGIRSTYEGTITSEQSAADIIWSSVRIGTVKDQLIYNGAGGFTGNGSGTLDTITGKFKVSYDIPPQLNARVIAYSTVNYKAGSVLTLGSQTDNMPIKYVVQVSLSPGDSFRVQDPIQSLVAMGTQFDCTNDTADGSGLITNQCTDPGGNPTRSNAIIMSRKAIVFGEESVWFRFNTGGGTGTMTFSRNGNEIFFGSGNNVRLIKGLSTVYDQPTADHLLKTSPIQTIYTGSGTCTRIVQNPSNENEFLCTFGNWGNGRTVVMLTYDKGTDRYTSVDKTGNLKDIKMPVYGAIFDINDPKKVILATDVGVWSTADITVADPVWTKEAFGNTLVFDIDQQHLNHSKAANHEMIYLGTYGRGIWKSGTLVGQNEYPDFASTERFKTSLKIYPNPVNGYANVNYTLASDKDVFFNIVDIRGNTVKTLRPSANQGENNTRIGVQDLPMGTYFLMLHAGKESKVAKFVKIR